MKTLLTEREIRRRNLVLIFCCLFFGSILIYALPLGTWLELQWQGQVPEGVSWNTKEGKAVWRVAQHTIWWGKRLNPEKFWKGRVVWNDASAHDAAARHGRSYPPVPTHLTNLTDGFPLGVWSVKDIAPKWKLEFGQEPQSPLHHNEEEPRYWAWFAKTKPMPPEKLEWLQLQTAEWILGSRQREGIDAQAEYSTDQEIRSENFDKSHAQAIGVPDEALTQEALFWSYVMAKRREYDRAKAEHARLDGRDRFVGLSPDELLVDRKFITEPLTPAQLRQANAWKIAYLQRLRRERVDESYINAYLKAWGLPPTENDNRS